MKLNELTPSLAADRLELFAREERLVQKTWHKMNGVERACLLGSFHPDIDATSKCPAQVMPRWCSELLVTLFDGIETKNIFSFGLNFAGALRKTEKFSVANWDTVRRKFLHATVSHALESARSVSGNLDAKGKAAWEEVQKAVGDVLLLLSQDKDVSASAASAASAAASAARSAAWSAESAAESAAWSAASAAESAAWSAAYELLFTTLITAIESI